jgi:ADP-heptose:LPS heptosyltransferase
MSVIFGGSRDDVSYIKKIEREMASSSIIAAGKLELTQTSALIKGAAAYVGLDSGPMHIAAMSGTPTVALFGPTHPERVGPYGVKSKVIQAQGIDCLCCRKRTCDTLKCMKAISVEQVFDSLCELLELKDYAGFKS